MRSILSSVRVLGAAAAGTAIAVAALGSGLATSAAVAATATTTTTTTTTPKATSPTLSGELLVLNNSDSGATFIADKGAYVLVILSSDLKWSEANTESGSTAELTKLGGEVLPSGESITLFKVAGFGSVEITATGAPICKAGVACPQFLLLWDATINSPVIDPPPPVAV